MHVYIYQPQTEADNVYFSFTAKEEALAEPAVAETTETPAEPAAESTTEEAPAASTDDKEKEKVVDDKKKPRSPGLMDKYVSCRCALRPLADLALTCSLTGSRASLTAPSRPRTRRTSRVRFFLLSFIRQLITKLTVPSQPRLRRLRPPP